MHKRPKGVVAGALQSQRADCFAKIAESLRQFRRAELLDFRSDLGGDPVDKLYVDPLESNAVLNTVLLNSTTFLVGRKGTGKSTVFVKAQVELRKRSDVASIYIDVKSLYELLSSSEAVAQSVSGAGVSEPVLRAHLLRKSFLSAVLADLVRELRKAYQDSSLLDRWIGSARSYQAVIGDLDDLSSAMSAGGLTSEELPILQIISAKTKTAESRKESARSGGGVGGKFGPKTIEVGANAHFEGLEEAVAKSEVYQEYADAILRSFPFQNFLERLRELLRSAGLTRLFIFFDDFSELSWLDQRLFVDVILSPLNNASDEMVRLKIAGYPGRIYYGKIDPGKVDHVGLDFYDLYKANEIQVSEAAAIEYLQRLLERRFECFGATPADYFDSSIPMAEHYRLLFEITLNVPRLIGYILHYCYLDRVSRQLPITTSALRLASQRYYEAVLLPYFDRMNRFAMEPFERKLDRHNQKGLLQALEAEARNVRRGISTGHIGGRYFHDLTNPPVSHFTVDPSMEKLLSSLELNMLLTKYHEMRDKSGRDIVVYAFFYGLCEAERFPWGYPKGRRDDRSYFVQRCFNFNATIQQFLSRNQTIRCADCSACFGMEKKQNIEFYKWRCPDCQTGTCEVISLDAEFQQEMERLEKATMLPPVELEILETLNEEGNPMRAGEIAGLVDATYQLVGHRTAKLSEMGLVKKSIKESVTRSTLTDKARTRYFRGAVEHGGDEAPTHRP
jgi:hypothetical protein